MRKLAVCVSASVGLSFLPMAFYNSSDAWEVAVWSLMAQVCIWVWLSFSFIEKYRVAERSFMACFFVWSTLDVATYWLWDVLDSAGMHIWPVFFALCSSWAIFVAIREYEFTESKKTPGNVHLLLLRPLKNRSVFISLMGLPFASVCVYAHGGIWSYRWGEKTFSFRKISIDAVSKTHLIIDTGKEETEETKIALLSCIGLRASNVFSLWTRVRCVYAIRPLLKELGENFIPCLHEHIPCFYAVKIMRLKDDRCTTKKAL